MNFKDSYKSAVDEIHGDKALLHMILNGETKRKKSVFSFRPAYSAAIVAVFAVMLTTLFFKAGINTHINTGDNMVNTESHSSAAPKKAPGHEAELPEASQHSEDISDPAVNDETDKNQDSVSADNPNPAPPKAQSITPQDKADSNSASSASKDEKSDSFQKPDSPKSETDRESSIKNRENQNKDDSPSEPKGEDQSTKKPASGSDPAKEPEPPKQSETPETQNTAVPPRVAASFGMTTEDEVYAMSPSSGSRGGSGAGGGSSYGVATASQLPEEAIENYIRMPDLSGIYVGNDTTQIRQTVMSYFSGVQVNISISFTEGSEGVIISSSPKPGEEICDGADVTLCVGKKKS